jgi:hypothetical protein
VDMSMVDEDEIILEDDGIDIENKTK